MTEIKPVRVPEAVRGPVSTPPANQVSDAPGVEVLADPTQVRRPWRSTIRTVFQIAVSLATLIPFVVTGIYEDGDQAPAVIGQVLGVCAAVTRVMALPQVEAFLRKFAPFLAAAPAGAAAPPRRRSLFDKER